MPWHVVEQGETLFGLARKNGLEDWRKIYDHPENSAFREKRPDPGVLFPGDRVFIPNKELLDRALAVDRLYNFKMKAEKPYVRLAVCDGEGRPLAGKEYELEVGGVSVCHGTLPANGIVEAKVPIDAREGRLVVTLDADREESREWKLQLGSMDPLTEICGIQARLQNLGFYEGGLDGELNDETRTAIWAFQARQGLEPTGRPDEVFRGKLDSVYTPKGKIIP